MQPWIDVYSSAGVKQCEISTATNWQNEPLLSKIGTFSFDIPFGDSKVQYLADDARVYCYGIVDGAITELGAGIVKKKVFKPGSNGSMLTVSGQDLMAELAGIRVASYFAHTDEPRMPINVSYWQGISEPYLITLTNAFDGALPGNSGTSETFKLYLSDGDPRQDFLYVAYTEVITGVYFEIDATINNGQTSALDGQYYTIDDGWVALTNLSDGTSVLGATMAQSGYVNFDKPLGAEMTDGAYVFRFAVSADTDDIKLYNTKVIVETPSAVALSELIALAPTWALDTSEGSGGYSETLNTVYHQFIGLSLFACLVKLAELTGEQFRYSATRKICWLQTYQIDSGVRATNGGDPTAIDAIDYLCQVESLEYTRDSFEKKTRVYPTGGGSGDAILTLESTNRAVEAGYTLVLDGVNSYIKDDDLDAADSSFYDLKDTSIVPKDTSKGAQIQAANQLYDVGLAWLKRHAVTVEQFRFTVVGLKQLVYPGQTIHLTYHEYRDGYHALDIDDDLIVLSPKNQVETDGVYTVGFTVSTSTQWIITNDEFLAGKARQVDALSTVPQPVAATNIMTNMVPAGSIPVATSTGYVHKSLDEIASGGSSSGGSGYVPLGGGTMSGLLSLVNTLAQGNNLITAINSGNSSLLSARVSGLDTHTSNSDIHIAHSGVSITAGDGLTGGGAIDSTRTISLTAPGTLTVSSSNASAGSHTHAITSNSNPGTNAAILATDAVTGLLTLATANITGQFKLGGDWIISRSAANVATMASGDALESSYTAGWAGGGFHFDYNQSYANQSFLELDRLSVRGIMNVYELLVHQIRATNGSFFVANTGKAKTVTDNGGGSYTVETEDIHGFAVNDIIRAQRFTGTGTYQSDLTVTAVADTTHFTATLRATYTAPAAGMEFVRLGNSSDTDRQGSIYLTADDTGAPYINILAGVDAFTDWGSSANTRARIGNMYGAYGTGNNNYYGIGLGDYDGGNYLKYETNGGFVLKAGSGSLTIDAAALTITGTSQIMQYADSASDRTGKIWNTGSGFQMQLANYTNGGIVYSYVNLADDRIGMAVGSSGPLLWYIDQSESLMSWGGNALISGGLNLGVAIGTTAGAGEIKTTSHIHSGDNIYIANSSGDANNTLRLDGYADTLYIVADSAAGAATGTQIIFRTATATATATDKMTIDENGYVGILTNDPGYALDVNSAAIRIRTSSTVTNSNDPGVAGEIRWDGNYIYVGVGASTWKRAALSTW